MTTSEVENGSAKEFPELFFCLAAPIGVNLDMVCDELEEKLHNFNYKVVTLRLTDFLSAVDDRMPVKFDSLAEKYDARIISANSLRQKLGNDLMAAAALFSIKAKREEISGNRDKPAPRVAYIIRQLKRPEEIGYFRNLYDRQVFQISAYADEDVRKANLSEEMKSFHPTATRSMEFDGKALDLIRRDEHEDDLAGQQLREVFPLADVFVDATTQATARATIGRFLNLVFGYNFGSPSREEYGMYLAQAASLRSVDLSRQVGAAICGESGEVKVMGCNEVPSPDGGAYWEDDDGDSREFKRKADTNDEFRHRVLGDILDAFAKNGIINQKYAVPSRQFLAMVKTEKGVDLRKTLRLMDLIEYGRMLHAEMNAITDAARLGIPLDKTTLYCTTFPCHLCAKHIIASGINRVVYIEPYPKGYAQELYKDEILVGLASSPGAGRVHFEPFIGVAPFRYGDFFQKGRRKDDEGRSKEWQFGTPRPFLTRLKESYPNDENVRLVSLIAAFAKAEVLLPRAFVGPMQPAAAATHAATTPGKVESVSSTSS